MPLLTIGAPQKAPSGKVRAYPDVIPKDVSFETVVSSQPYPPVKYPVPIIGWKEHPEEFHVAPKGAIVSPAPNPETPGASPSKERGYYIVPLIGLASGSSPALFEPDHVEQELVDGYMPGVKSAWTKDGLKFTQLAFCTLLEGTEVRTGREPLLALVRYTLVNEKGPARKVFLWLNFGQAVYGHGIFQVPPKYPQTLSYDSPFVAGSSGKAVVAVLSVPKSGVVSFHPLSDGPRPASGAKPGEHTKTAEDKEKQAKPAPGNPRENSLCFELNLAGGESRSIDLAIPYYPLEKDALRALVTPGQLRETDGSDSVLDSRLALFRNYWKNELNGRAVFNIPEPRIDNSYRTCLANNLMLTDRSPVNGSLHIHPDATHYEFVWAGDSACILHAYDRLGYHGEAASYLRYFLARQGTRRPEGDVSSADGFLPGDQPGLRWMGENGFILWAMAEHYKLSGDKEWLKSVAPAMMKSADWIIRERARTKTLVNGEQPRHYGLLPRGRTSDNPEIDHLYWTDNYSYGGLRGTADVLGEIGLKAKAARYAAEADDYRACLRESVERSIVREADPPFVPLGPYKNKMPTETDLANDWYSLSGPVYMVEMGIFGARDPKVGWINATVEKYVMASGLPTLSRPGFIDPHYVYNQALSQLLRGETEKFLWTFYSMFAYGQSRSTYSTVECNDIFTGESGESWDALRQPHEHSNSRVIAMVRIAFLLEEGETLHLLPGTPRGWLEPGKVIEVKNAPTYFGEVSVRAEAGRGAKEIRYVIDPPARKKASIVLHLRPPTIFGVVKSVEVDGKRVSVEGETVDLGPLSARTQVACTY
ncbi:MAG: hypothetical protein A2W03_10585 [Candidatus Aminicenantes bacterium RBG_16_63_16]|nr:MAG: hypothetical protein A2W03_10585 [Candidatus Aminicenantes bacterium RBG_16_63_16]